MPDTIEPETADQMDPELEPAEPEGTSRKKALVLIAAAAAAFTLGAVLAVNVVNARADDADAVALTDHSAATAATALAECVATAESSTWAADTAAYVAIVSEVYGAESEEVGLATAAVRVAEAHTAADCRTVDISKLGAGVDPSDNADFILAANTAVVVALSDWTDGTADADMVAAAALASARTLPAAHEAYSAALKELNATVKSSDDLVGGDLAKIPSDEDAKSATAASKSATTAKDDVASTLDILDVAALEAATEPLSR
ncbi:hypothetical protein [Demequina aurantiaca]|uniref:hypothetical protein n=1 Tax=Demequina aurantiaca TaxID=676200 RepID=UPI003D34A585